MTSPLPLSREERLRWQETAASGQSIPYEIIQRYVATTRQSWLAKPPEKTEGKSRNAKPPAQQEIDFF